MSGRVPICAESLVTSIRREFAAVPFPSHCGLHAAMAQDDWVDDELTLAKITKREDFVGEWWDVPIAHLRSCMMALSYLDAHGIAFYLPAYMTALVARPADFDSASRASSFQVVLTMLPPDNDSELKPYFLSRFSLIEGARKQVCRQFLTYLSESDAYDERATRTAREAVAHEFWSSQSQDR